jgi:5-carboxymethyl-2-hydroxymuconic-semialdehyde dehydrogenase
MCFVNSQNVRDLASRSAAPRFGTPRGRTWSYEVFCEPKNICVSIADHHIPHWGA